MKPLKQHELEQVAGGYDWNDFTKDVKDGWNAFLDSLSNGNGVDGTFKNIVDAVTNN
ncbi:hypothetical protein [Neisseria sp.]|uniref:hypothetical protein n=1 Tax=Neisseria sp. TaxID=192066 RepID=UPI0035A05D08